MLCLEIAFIRYAKLPMQPLTPSLLVMNRSPLMRLLCLSLLLRLQRLLAIAPYHDNAEETADYRATEEE